MKNGQMCEMSQKGPPGPRCAKTSIFSISLKVFKIEENHHILTPGLLKYKTLTHLDGNGHMCELSQKGPPGPRWPKTSIFSISRLYFIWDHWAHCGMFENGVR